MRLIGPSLEPPPPDPQPTEQRVIDLLLAGRAAMPDWLALDAGDDGAVLADGQAITVDALVEGVHFDHRLTPEDVGFKSIAVSVSDLGAMGAAPRWAVCALSLPRDPDPLPWVEGFAAGLRQACTVFGVRLVGGDVTSAPVGSPRYVANTLGGAIPGAPLTRGGARPGHELWVTGTPGLAGAGWMLDDPPEAALRALRRPSPPLQFAVDLVEQGLATAGMDLSDGPAADLPRLAAASGVRVVLDPSRLPVAQALRDHPHARRAQLLGGEDYELVFTADPAARPRILALAERHGVRVTVIGEVIDGQGVALLGEAWPSGAWAHFHPRTRGPA